MKLYNPNNTELIRLSLTQKDKEKEYLCFTEVDLVNCHKAIERLIKSRGYKESEDKTQITFREYKEGKHGKSKTMTVKGATPQNIKSLILKIWQK